ncbi:MAG: hypothetical protein COA96_16415 [SAR86 cluster bacterium]|uniref:Uncharacterized protein n=1 Tax=SAR86 cluster bacterium TaxID=2030880 RepID=A0A2A5AIB5_9GAMM|nr:MAG: hypothetical protein COA96_16415 [SAR86 cluster bacterium]
MIILRFARLIPLWLILQGQMAVAADSLESTDEPEESALQLSTRLIQQRDLFDLQLEALESEYGPFDRSLLEPLQGLTKLLVEAGDLDEADRVLSRRLQLLRIDEGLNTLNQIPVLVEQISNDLERGQWKAITGHFEHIVLLHTQNPDAGVEPVLNAMNDLLSWHYSAIYIDEPLERIDHFFDAREIQQGIISLAEREFETDREMLIPWLYELALEQLHIAAILTSQDELGHEARGIIKSTEAGALRFLRRGLSIVKIIQGIVETMDDPEAEAMAMLYVADFQMNLRDHTPSVFGAISRITIGRRGVADGTYRQAMKMLETAGVTEQRIEAFFARPVLLPVPQYHFSLDAALTQQVTDGYKIQQSAEDTTAINNGINMGDFVAWNKSLPSVRRPVMHLLTVPFGMELNTVQVRFSINSIGKARSARAVQTDPNTPRINNDGKNAIKGMQFRPVFIRGKFRKIRNVTMQYSSPPY